MVSCVYAYRCIRLLCACAPTGNTCLTLLLAGHGNSIFISFRPLDLAAPNRSVFIRWTAARLTEFMTEGMDFVEVPWDCNLLIRLFFFNQFPAFLGFTICFPLILYLFQGRSIRNKSWEHLHINNSHVGDITISRVTEMRKVLLICSWRADQWVTFSAPTHRQLR